MEQMWIGTVKANDVSGTIGFGYAILTGVRTVSKSNAGNGTVTGDYGQLPALAARVDDADGWDCPVLTNPPFARG